MITLPVAARRLAQSWGFVPEEELPSGHCSRIFADESRILKVPFQGEELTYGAVAAFKIAGAGGPEVFHVDSESGVVLMSRLMPGTELALSGLNEAETQAVFVDIARRIAGLRPDGAMPLRDYIGFDHPLLEHLEATTETRSFLHGDLHHHNILADGDAWRPIDPKGLVGDPHYECVAYLRNPIEKLRTIDDLLGFTRSRIESLASQLGLDCWRIAACGFLDSLDSEHSGDHPWGRLNSVYKDLMRGHAGR